MESLDEPVSLQYMNFQVEMLVSNLIVWLHYFAKFTNLGVLPFYKLTFSIGTHLLSKDYYSSIASDYTRNLILAWVNGSVYI